MQRDKYEEWQDPKFRALSLLYLHGVLPFLPFPPNDIDQQGESADEEIEVFLKHCEELNV